MKQYKVTIFNGDYPLTCTCNTISDAFVQMRKNEVLSITRSGYSVSVLE